MKKYGLCFVITAALASVLIGMTGCSSGGIRNHGKTLPDRTESGEETENGSRETGTVTEYPETRLTADGFSCLRLHGRTVTDSRGLRLDWSYSGFTAEGYFSGDVVAEIRTFGDKQCYIHITADGEDSVSVIEPGTEETVLATVSPGYHVITVRKATEIRTSRLAVSALRFKGAAVTPEKTDGLKIEFIGDSVTCGVGSSPDAGNGYSDPRDCDVFNSYAVMTGKVLDAEINLVSAGGWGVSKGAGKNNGRIPDIYRYTSFRSGMEEWNFAAWKPDVVVIALGANDEGADPAVFGKAVYDFLVTVRECNPDAKIVWMYGYLFTGFTDVIGNAIEKTGDRNIFLLEVKPDMSGGWKHPSYSAQCGFAEALTAKIRDIVSSR